MKILWSLTQHSIWSFQLQFNSLYPDEFIAPAVERGCSTRCKRLCDEICFKGTDHKVDLYTHTFLRASGLAAFGERPEITEKLWHDWLHLRPLITTEKANNKLTWDQPTRVMLYHSSAHMTFLNQIQSNGQELRGVSVLLHVSTLPDSRLTASWFPIWTF